MLLLALTERAATLADAGAETRPGELEDGNGSKQEAGEERNQKREEQDRPIDADFTNARKSCGGDAREDAQRTVSETQSDSAAEQSENDAFEQEVRSDAAAARAQGGAHGQFLAAAFDADEQQISDIGTGDKEDHADRTHEDPEDAADVADDVVLERTDVGANLRVLEELDAEARRGRKGPHNDGKHASNIGVDLLEGDAGPKPGETVVAEVAEGDFAAVKLERGNQGGIIAVQEMKSLRQEAGDLPGLSIHDD